ncbi:hypothetical protein LVD13_04960 [Flavobacteriaceae bacterium D16]|nr:hypothetical protein [Flavobacteriaceae bacterium D16]
MNLVHVRVEGSGVFELLRTTPMVYRRLGSGKISILEINKTISVASALRRQTIAEAVTQHLEIFNKKVHFSFLLFLLSMVLPIFINAWSLLGFMGFLLGWIGLISGKLLIGLPWISNILYLVSLLATRIKLKNRIKISSIAIIFGLLAIGIREIPENEGGNTMTVYVGLGWLVWMASFIYLLKDQVKEYKELNVG